MWRCCGRLPLRCCGGGGPWLFSRQALQCGCMAHRSPPCECPRPTHWDSGRKSREFPLEPAAPAGRSWAVRVGCFHHTCVVMAFRSGGSGDASDAATRRGVEELGRPQWTMSSSVEDILLEGETLSTDMKLNDFLRSNLGDEWVVERNGNVAMGNFVQ
ncbi:retrotransposon hot spot protein (RHS), putative, partial [Trypanosoma cruzi]